MWFLHFTYIKQLTPNAKLENNSHVHRSAMDTSPTQPTQCHAVSLLNPHNPPCALSAIFLKN